MTTGKSDLRWKTAAAVGPNTKRMKKFISDWAGKLYQMDEAARGVGPSLTNFLSFWEHLNHVMNQVNGLPVEEVEKVSRDLIENRQKSSGVYRGDVAEAREKFNELKSHMKNIEKFLADIENLKPL